MRNLTLLEANYLFSITCCIFWYEFNNLIVKSRPLISSYNYLISNHNINVTKILYLFWNVKLNAIVLKLSYKTNNPSLHVASIPSPIYAFSLIAYNLAYHVSNMSQAETCLVIESYSYCTVITPIVQGVVCSDVIRCKQVGFSHVTDYLVLCLNLKNACSNMVHDMRKNVKLAYLN